MMDVSNVVCQHQCRTKLDTSIFVGRLRCEGDVRVPIVKRSFPVAVMMIKECHVVILCVQGPE